MISKGDTIYSSCTSDPVSWRSNSVCNKVSLKLFAYYSLPAMLYAVVNVLGFYAIASLGPAHFHLWYNLKIPMTAFLLTILGRRNLSRPQMVALLVLLLACVLGTLPAPDTALAREEAPAGMQALYSGRHMLNQGLGGRVSVPTRHGPYSLAGRSLPGKQERISSIEHQRGRHGRTLLVHKSHGHSHGSTQKVREHDFYMNDFTKG